VRKTWLHDQIRFHDNKSKQAGRMSHWLEWSGIAIFPIALIVRCT